MVGPDTVHVELDQYAGAIEVVVAIVEGVAFSMRCEDEGAGLAVLAIRASDPGSGVNSLTISGFAMEDTSSGDPRAMSIFSRRTNEMLIHAIAPTGPDTHVTRLHQIQRSGSQRPRSSEPFHPAGRRT